MISFSNINKRYGKQLLFVDASFQLNPGRKSWAGGSQWGGQDNALLADSNPVLAPGYWSLRM
ncbi:MAG: hypothetical protein WA437_20385 [Candidatus Sulfotelmatobacter sp.]